MEGKGKECEERGGKKRGGKGRKMVRVGREGKGKGREERGKRDVL